MVIRAIVLMNVLGQVQQTKAQDAQGALVEMTAAMSSVLRDGQGKRAPS
ncbi:MAG TPA: hypothetical protein VFA81_08095 [Burkholderiales bacterium]|nr:hypothetical protein [Burkholderiales bacterium]